MSTRARPVLTPTPNLAAKFQDVVTLQENIKLRGLDVDAMELKALYEFFCSLDEMRGDLERRRVEIASQIKDMKQVGGKEADAEKEKLILEGRHLREDLKNLMQAFWEVEERMMVNALALPNTLHPRTPLADPTLVSQHGTLLPGTKTKIDHLVAGNDFIDYRDPHWFYLKNSAAVFDLAVMYYFVDGLKAAGYSPMVPPDFSAAAVVEACGTSPEKSLLLKPRDENMNLVGGASLFPFCSYYAKQTLPVKYLPVKHLVGGKKYIQADGPGLFGAWQRTSVDIFASTSNAEETEKLFDSTLEKLTALYENLGWSFRVVYVPAAKLKAWESFRASFEMFSTSLDRHVEVGSLSLSGSFLSERLSMEFEESDRARKFCEVLSGNAVDVTLVLACLIEQGVVDLLPEALTKYSFGTR